MLRQLFDAPSSWTALDRVADPLRDLVQRAPQPLRRALHGAWLGHPVHPVPAQLAVGCYTSAALVDVMARGMPTRSGTRAGARLASTMLLAAGTAAAVPSVASGLTDWAELHEDQQRTGLVHAALNAAATAAAVVAIARRLRHPRTLGSGSGPSSLLAAGLTGAGAALGGHLAYRWSAGANHAEDVPHTGPGDWVDIGGRDEFGDRQPVGRRAGGVDVVAVRVGERLHVLADRCSHLGASLAGGEVREHDGQTCVVCPWHASTFRLDGEPVAGPAVSPQPRFEVREDDGRVRVRVVTLPGVDAS